MIITKVESYTIIDYYRPIILQSYTFIDPLSLPNRTSWTSCSLVAAARVGLFREQKKKYIWSNKRRINSDSLHVLLF